ncbi:ribosomal protein S18-alanine N-acetyltransferase [Pelagibaculum spongiae]|uniref:Ribosomal-protein-alanine N-acetyltransferase n=1 Tax=Pelagibaculum spongiae TaxID=2080658 RepID=A0A2V1H0D2_9GAMM|nr:ribosomal protein S18-alanine N-acetyltransferase [Pelagibaculum spongiae]PVZ72119.1 ribosomal-protein-alanine N-acetyltransferase [Pelagibaculum spongiae]
MVEVAVEHFSFRPIEAADIDALVALEKIAQESPWGEQSFKRCLNPTFSGWIVDAVNQPLSVESERSDVDDSDAENTICAFAIFQAVADESHLLDIVVDPELQGQGIGRQLLGFIIDRAREVGAIAMYLEVRQSNLAAKSLYLSMGFLEVAERKNYYKTLAGEMENASVMMRAI